MKYVDKNRLPKMHVIMTLLEVIKNSNKKAEVVEKGKDKAFADSRSAFNYNLSRLLEDIKNNPNSDTRSKDKPNQYVVFDGNQIKLTSNAYPTDDSDIRFSLNVLDESSSYWDTYKQVSTVTRHMDSIKDVAVSAKKFTSKDIDVLKFDLVGTYNMSTKQILILISTYLQKK